MTTVYINGEPVEMNDEAIAAFSAPVSEPDGAAAAFVPVSMMRQRVERLGMLDAFSAYMAANPPLMMKLLTLESGVDPAYPALVEAFDEMHLPAAARDYLLAPPSAGVGDPPAMG